MAFHLNWITFIIGIPRLYVLNMKSSPDFLWVFLAGIDRMFGIVLNALVKFGGCRYSAEPRDKEKFKNFSMAEKR